MASSLTPSGRFGFLVGARPPDTIEIPNAMKAVNSSRVDLVILVYCLLIIASKALFEITKGTILSPTTNDLNASWPLAFTSLAIYLASSCQKAARSISAKITPRAPQGPESLFDVYLLLYVQCCTCLFSLYLYRDLVWLINIKLKRDLDFHSARR